MDELSEIIARMPTWNNTDDISWEPFGGLTNHNYLVKVNGQGYVVRISGKNTRRLGISRALKYESYPSPQA